MTYRNKMLKLRLQQTSSGIAKEWFQCIDMKDVDVPSPGFWGISCQPTLHIAHRPYSAPTLQPTDPIAQRPIAQRPYSPATLQRTDPTAHRPIAQRPIEKQRQTGGAAAGCSAAAQRPQRAATRSSTRCPRALLPSLSPLPARRSSYSTALPCLPTRSRSPPRSHAPPRSRSPCAAATGDLVDNHDIIQFITRPLTGIDDAEADYDAWANAEQAAIKHKMEEFDLRPPEALQRDYQRVLRAQAEAIKTLQVTALPCVSKASPLVSHLALTFPTNLPLQPSPPTFPSPCPRLALTLPSPSPPLQSDVETLKQTLEFQLAAMHTGIQTTRKSLDDKSEAISSVTQHMARADELHKTVKEQEGTLMNLKVMVKDAQGGGGWKWPFFFLFLMIVALAGVGYNRYQKLYGKSHLP